MSRSRSIGTCAVEIWKFERGTQGQLDFVEEIQRTVYETSAVYPTLRMCADSPLKRRTYNWIAYKCERWPTQQSEHGVWVVRLPGDTEAAK